MSSFANKKGHKWIKVRYCMGCYEYPRQCMKVLKCVKIFLRVSDINRIRGVFGYFREYYYQYNAGFSICDDTENTDLEYNRRGYNDTKFAVGNGSILNAFEPNGPFWTYDLKLGPQILSVTPHIFETYNLTIDLLLESEFIPDMPARDQNQYNDYLHELKIPQIRCIRDLRAKATMIMPWAFVKSKKYKKKFNNIHYCCLPIELHKIVLKKLN